MYELLLQVHMPVYPLLTVWIWIDHECSNIQYLICSRSQALGSQMSTEATKTLLRTGHTFTHSC